MGQEQTGSAAAQSKRAFEQITPTHGNTYASKLERRDLTAFYVSTDGAVVALESPYAAGPAFMSNAEAEAIGRELLKAAGAQDHAPALLEALIQLLPEAHAYLVTVIEPKRHASDMHAAVYEEISAKVNAARAAIAAATGGAQ
jgi:hypothetical protein